MKSKDQHLRILEHNYQIEVTSIDKLMSYDIATYKVRCSTGMYVLKQYPNTKVLRSKVSHENKVLNGVKNKISFEIPEIILSHKGEELVIAESYFYRLQTFLEGEFLGQARPTKEVLYSLGRNLGELDSALADSDLPAPPIHDREWDLKHVLENMPLLAEITSVDLRRLISYFLFQFEEIVLPRYYDLPLQLIHGDANDWNVLQANGTMRGLIDFGDLCQSWRINELAIAIAYGLMGQEEILSSAERVVSGYAKHISLTDIEVKCLYYLIAARLCTTLCHSAKSQRLDPDNEYLVISQKPGEALLRKWIRINPLNAEQVFREAAGLPSKNVSQPSDLLKGRGSLLSPSLSLSYEDPIPMYKSALQYMYDYEGNTYLDAYNNIMLVGHSHPDVIRAGQSVMSRLNTNTRYLYPELNTYAQNLLNKFPSSLDKVFFVNSGSAATDLALRLARSFTNRKKTMVLEEGYHGNTQSAIEVSQYKYSKVGSIGKSDFIIEAKLPNAFLLDVDSRAQAGAIFAKMAKEQIKANEGELGVFIAEPIVGCGGQVPLPSGYLSDVYKAIRDQGGVCISDEVQLGFGRLGKYFWGYEMHDVIPDIVILGKPMGNGHPIGAVVTTKEIAEKFAEGPEFFSSFGGNPVSCIIGNEVLSVIQRDSLQEHAKEVGDYFKEQLELLKVSNSSIGDIRGEGLFLGVEIINEKNKPDGILANHIINFLRENNILSSTDGPHGQVIKIKPPLCFSLENVDEFVSVFRKSLALYKHN